MTYSHHGISYNTPAEAIAASIYDYMTAMGNNSASTALAQLINPYKPWGGGNSSALKSEMEANDWASCDGDTADWNRALEMAIDQLCDELS